MVCVQVVMHASHSMRNERVHGQWGKAQTYSSRVFMTFGKYWRRLQQTHSVKLGRSKYVIIGLLLALLYFLFFRQQIPYIASSSPHDKFADIQPDFLNPHDFDVVKKACLENQLTAQYDYSDIYLGSIKGWVVKFNTKGLARFTTDIRFTGLLPFFRKVVMEGSNAFVVRLLIGLPDSEGEFLVSRHSEDTVAIQSSKRYAAHNVSLITLDVPEDMLGGEIIAWPGLAAKKPMRDIPVLVFPANNLMLTLRGDSEYVVKSFRSQSNHHLMILIVEQYQIPTRFSKLLTDFCTGHQCQ